MTICEIVKYRLAGKQMSMFTNLNTLQNEISFIFKKIGV